jgi:RNA polymerase sigma-70 factor (ECF subfamily)
VTTSDARTEEFEAAAAPYRRELFAHCYRMTGSVGDAEDLVQETYLRAWQAFDRFEGRSSMRTWMYRIATNASLSALRRTRRRPLPSGLGAPSDDPAAPARPSPDGVAWLEPVPDRLVIDDRSDPAEIVAARHSVRLALVAAFQLLAPRQRAALILCDTLGLPAGEAAEILQISVPAVKSLLQRARARIASADVRDADLAEPADEGARRVLDRYMAAFERSDSAAIKRLLADDAVLEMTGTSTWFSGKATCVPFISGQAIGRPGDWLMLPVRANGQLAAAAYHRAGGAYRAFAIVVLATSTTQLRRITLFGDPELFKHFNLPAERPALAGGVGGWCQERQRPVQGGGERDPAVHPGQPQQLAGLRPGTDRVHGGAVRGGAAGRADQDPQPGRIDKGDPVQIDDQRLPAVCQPEQAFP